MRLLFKRMDSCMMETLERLAAGCSPELAKACLVLVLIGVAVIISLFAYVGRRSESTAYRYWTIGWLFYAVFVASMIAAETVLQDSHLATIPSACVAMQARQNRSEIGRAHV